MSKYKINGIEFKNKNQITQKCRNIIEKYNPTDVVEGDDEKFMLELFKFHPDNEKKLENYHHLSLNTDYYGKNMCFFIHYDNDRISDISFTKCINHIPFSDDLHVEYNMPFGKYKGQSIYEIVKFDKRYLEWIKDNIADRGLKIKINQLLRYGYIPYNPIAVQKEKEKRNKLNTTKELNKEYPQIY